MRTDHNLHENDVKKAIAFWIAHNCPEPAGAIPKMHIHYDKGSDNQLDLGNGLSVTVIGADK